MFPETNMKHLISPKLDFFLIGGLSILFYIITYLIPIKLIKLDYIFIMWVLAFFVNSPHFIISYQIFYLEHRNDLFSNNRLLLSGIIIPIALLMIISLGMLYNSKMAFLLLLFSMFFSVGWHYIKQAYGCFIVYSGIQGYFLSSDQVKLIKFSLYSLWIISFFNIFTSSSVKDFWGLSYSTPAIFIEVRTYLSLFSLVFAVPITLILISNTVKNNANISLTAMTPLICIFLWLSPAFYNEVYFYMIPFFHSLQYILFTYTYTKSKTNNKKSKIFQYWGIAFIVGALFFHLIPSTLDSNFNFGNDISPNIFLISFIFFINIHHYFIDNCLWRRENEKVRQHIKSS